MNLRHIEQVAIPVRDLARATAFYRDTLGMKFLFEAPPAMAFFDCGGVRLMLSLPEQAGAVAGQQFGSILYYAVDDIQQAAQVLRIPPDVRLVVGDVGNRQQLRKFIEDLSLVRAAVIANRSLCVGRLKRERQCRHHRQQ